VNKRLLWNLLKYVLALGLLSYVVWSNWGDSRRVAARIVLGDTPSKGMVTGTVTAYTSGQSITLQDQAGQQTEYALVKDKTKIELADGLDLGVGQEVAIQEAPRGLAYVWHKHVVQREPVPGPGYFVLAVLICLVSVLITFFRWYILVRAQGLPFTLPNALRLGMVGYFFNAFLPGSVGGDIIKAAFLAREQSRRTVAVATVIMDRAIALWALIWFVALAGIFFWIGGFLQGDARKESEFIILAAASIVGVTLLMWIVLGLLPDHRAERFAGRLSRLPKVGHAAAEFWRAVWMYRCQQRYVAASMLISWVGHVGFVLTFYFSVLTLWDPSSGLKIPSLAEHFLIVPIGLVIQAMPLFPGGAGIGELGFGGLYSWLGCPPVSGVLGSLVQRVITWVLGLFGYLVYLRMKPRLATMPPTTQGLSMEESRNGQLRQAEEPVRVQG
jgi:hypothetical protein